MNAREIHNDGARPARRRGMGMGGGRGRMLMPGEKARDFRGTMRKLIRYLGRYRTSIIIALIFAAASTGFSIVGPRILGNATTKLFEGLLAQLAGTGSIDFTAIGQILLTALGLYLVSAAFAYAQGWLMSSVSANISYGLRKDIFAKINRMPFKYFDGTNHGEVLSHITNDVDTVNQTLNQSLSQMITSVATLIGVLIMMFSINWLMSVVVLLILPLSLLFIRQIVSRSQKFFAQQQDYLGHVNGYVEEMYGAHDVVKAFNGEERNIHEFDQYNNVLHDAAWRSQFLSGMMMPVMTFIGNLGYVAVTILGGYLAVQGTITVGDIQAFIQYVRSFNQPIAQIGSISNVLQQTAAAAERVFDFLEQEEETPDPANPIQLRQVEGWVEFDHVRFGYSPDRVVIKDFSTLAKPGQKIAIVGPTGAGKTTLVKLLMRFYDPLSGSVRLENHDLREMRRGDLRRLFGMVLQDTWLFNGTIMDNIRYGKPDATEEEVIRAAKAAHIDHYVRTLPEGYNTMLNEETSNISEGEKQLLTIARAILINPKLLILDEATSNVDTRTEIRIQKAMDELMRGRTSFIIAHRLSTIRNADLILVIRDGDIVEQGTHEELLERGGFYAELYNSQFESATAV